MRILSILSFLAAALAAPLSDSSLWQVYRFQVKTKEQAALIQSFVDDLTLHLDVWSHGIHVGDVDVLIPPHAVPKVSSLLSGVPNQILIQDVEGLVENEVRHSAENQMRFADTNDLVADKVFSDYQDRKTYLDFLLNVPGAEYIEIGQSYLNQTIGGVKFGKGPKHIVYHGGIHAREWISPASVTFITYNLMTDPKAAELREKYTFSVIPVLNVDGYDFTRESPRNRLWRKNRQVNAGTRCVGIDINRNFPFQWDAPSQVKNPCEETYRGPAPFAAPEAKAIADYLKSLPNVVSYIDFHSYSQLWMFPWGYTCDKKVPEYKILQEASKRATDAIKATSNVNFRFGDICNIIYPAAGGTIDYSYTETNTKFSFAIELRDQGRYGFVLPASQIVPAGEETYAAVLALWNYMTLYLEGGVPSEEPEQPPAPLKKCPVPQCWTDKGCGGCCFTDCP